MDSSQEAEKCNNLRCKSNVGGEVEPICAADEEQFDEKTGGEVCALSPCYASHIKQDRVTIRRGPQTGNILGRSNLVLHHGYKHLKLFVNVELTVADDALRCFSEDRICYCITDKHLKLFVNVELTIADDALRCSSVLQSPGYQLAVKKQ